MPQDLAVAAWVPLSSLDFPGTLSAVVFCQGCAWRCRYCHNPGLQPFAGKSGHRWEAVLAFLASRRGLLDGVVFSGGEPTLQAGLLAALKDVRRLGFRTGLHTAGMTPAGLRRVLPWLDWVGMDVKAPSGLYAALTGQRSSASRARASMRAIVESGVDHEFRTTVHAGLLPPAALRTLAHEIAELGARHLVVQAFRPAGCTDQPLLAQDAATAYDERLWSELASLFVTFSVRPAA